MLRAAQRSRYASLAKDVHLVPLTYPAMLQEYVASIVGPNDYT